MGKTSVYKGVEGVKKISIK